MRETTTTDGTGLLAPTVDEDGAPFWEYAERGELRVQACGACDRLRFPPRPCCPHCQSFDSTWRRMSGRGRIWSFVVPHPPLLPAYADQAPYNVILVELEEDPAIRLVGNLVPSPEAPLGAADPFAIRIGTPVRAVFAGLADGVTGPRWIAERP
ncbi:OB-fold domain-containing protein [Streptomyces sp. NPDC047108]|uniref:Zn-ribbon domain-containing OB-fold protein n=1 Tax=Streptomyces sp. NPDC047108 TaxID=3155025 RepID=UPI0033C06E1A